MTWAILLVFLIVAGVMSLGGRKQVAWVSKMWRVHAGVANKEEWMAPEEVVNAVREDYLAITRWLQESMGHDWAQQWAAAPLYLSGVCLKRHQEILKHYRLGKFPRYKGVLRCLHQVEVRHFSEEGERCLVVDRQTSRRMATYDYWTQTRLTTQDLGDGTVVYEMAYDKQTQ
ncbi:MAG: hypothetical protein H7Y09_09010, partial [Chitinophagaceae bacterium]|nr:hypothetical protein [Anaerolineae bacterium]